MKKFLVLLSMILLISAIHLQSFADDEENDDSSSTQSGQTLRERVKETRNYQEEENDDSSTQSGQTLRIQIEETRNYQKEELKSLREQTQEEIKANLETAKENRENFREEYKDDIIEASSNLTDEQKAQLETLKTDFETALEDLKQQLKDATTDEAKDTIREQMQTLAEDHYQAIIDLLGEDSAMAQILEARKSVFEENKTLRIENREIRREYLEVKQTKVNGYKTAFLKKLGDTIDMLSNDKLETINTRIDTMIENTQNNENLSDTQKQSLLSALVALKEIIEEKMEGDAVDDEVISVVEGLLEE